MKTLKEIITVLWKCWFLFLSTFLVLTIGIFWTYPLSFSAKTFPWAYKGIRLWAILVFFGSGFRLKFEGNLKLDPHKSYMLISNHTSIVDIMVMAVIHPNHPVVFVGKEELSKLPIFGTIYKRICIMVDRSDQKSKARVFRLAKEKIELGNSIVIFPEGGVSDDANLVLDKFKDGAFTIATITDLPIAVYAFKGLKEMFPFSWKNGYPGTVKVKLLDIIETKELSLKDKERLKESCFQKIFSELNSDKPETLNLKL